MHIVILCGVEFAGQFFRRIVAENFGHLGIGDQPARVQSGLEDALGGIFKNTAVFAFSVAQSLFGKLAFGDVDHCSLDEWRSLLFLYDRHVGEHPDGRAVFAAQAELDVAESFLAFQPGQEHIVFLRRVVECPPVQRKHFHPGPVSKHPGK